MTRSWRQISVAVALALVVVLGGHELASVPAVHALGGPWRGGRGVRPLLFNGTQECGNNSFSSGGGTTPIATGQTFECDVVTTVPITAGAVPGLVLVLQAPLGTVFDPTNPVVPGSLPPGCTVAGGGTPTLTISGCAATVPVGTVIETQLLGGPVPGTIFMTAAYTGGPAGPAFSFPYQFEGSVPPSPARVVTNANLVGTVASLACSNTTPGKPPTTPLVVGDTFACVVTLAAPSTPSVAAVNNTATPPGAGYTLTGTLTGDPGLGLNDYYLCGDPATNTPCTSFTITGTTTSPGSLAVELTFGALGAQANTGPTVYTPTSVPPITGPTFVFAAGGLNNPTTAAIGCANSTTNLDVAFPAVGGVLTGFQQLTTSPPLPTPGSAPGVLSVVAPTSSTGVNTAVLAAVECGAVFQDNAMGGPFFGQDADPNTIPGGTITFSLSGLTANGLTIAQILESGSSAHTVPCGDASLPAPVPGGPAAPNGLESCQGAVAGPTGPGFPPGSTVSPNPANIVHVGLRPGVTFSLIGGSSPAIGISATYQRFQALSAVPGVTGSGTITTNTATIGIATPQYAMSLTPSPASIPAALGSTTGSTITASLQRVTTFQCVSVSGGFSGFLVCGTPQGVLGVSPGSFGLVNGAEPGVVTFSTTMGVFGLPGTPLTGAQQVASVHCGPAPATAPVFLVPFLGQPFSFSFSACQTVSVTLFGGGEAGTAVVTGVYVGDFTGATATAATTVALTVSAPTVALTRGCNEVITGPTTPAAATATQILALVSPSSVVVSLWQFNNGLHAFQALYFSTAGAPTDISAVGPNQSIFICVSGAATFTTQ